MAERVWTGCTAVLFATYCSSAGRNPEPRVRRHQVNRQFCTTLLLSKGRPAATAGLTGICSCSRSGWCEQSDRLDCQQAHGAINRTNWTPSCCLGRQGLTKAQRYRLAPTDSGTQASGNSSDQQASAGAIGCVRNRVLGIPQWTLLALLVLANFIIVSKLHGMRSLLQSWLHKVGVYSQVAEFQVL
ncbi:hypothetical protein WJX79_004514 [Trebouxia sp. C0005]